MINYSGDDRDDYSIMIVIMMPERCIRCDVMGPARVCIITFRGPRVGTVVLHASFFAVLAPAARAARRPGTAVGTLSSGIAR